MEDFEIPIDKQIKEFKHHILANPRTFLSSKFGDGKSYFLNEFKGQNSDEFLFVTIYPVNYQVAANEDIFKLIKRDILFQLIVLGLFNNDVSISNDVLLWGYIQNNYKSVLVDLLPSIASVALPGKNIKGVLSFFKKQKECFDKYKKGNDKEAIIKDFLERVDELSVYEDDVVTELIKSTIEKYKEKNKDKKIVLIIEDLERLDPAHLFRILNIFSAHIDFAYKYLEKPNSSLTGNKFGFDNVIFVADYSNIREIFEHFYGKHTDFNGYIGKFLSSAPYIYSIREVRKDYIYDHLSKMLNCPRKFLEQVLTEEMLEDKTTRECIRSFDIASQIKTIPTLRLGTNEVVLDKTFLRILAVLRRLKIADEDILRTCNDLFYRDEVNFCKYVAPYLLLQDDSYCSLVVEIKTKHKEGECELFFVHINPDTGLGGSIERTLCYSDIVLTDFAKLYETIFEYLVK